MMKRQPIDSVAAFLLSRSSAVETHSQSADSSGEASHSNRRDFLKAFAILATLLAGRGWAVIGVILMVMLVNGLLLFAAGQFLNGSIRAFRLMLGCTFGAVWTGVYLLSQWDFSYTLLWRMVCLCVTSLITFGFSRDTIPKLLLFCLLHFSVGGITQSKNEMLPTLLGSAGICLSCMIVRKERIYIPVELSYGGRTMHLTALRDTGNTLRDPVTGRVVLIVDASIAENLIGLTINALQNPVASIDQLPGLRLIPYQTVGNSGFLLALSISNAKIGNRQGSALVAFSPQLFGSKYQALTGGSL